MAIETRVAQKDKLYALLRVKKAYLDKKAEVLPELEEAIRTAIAPMEAEDVAHIEKLVGMI